MIAYGGHGRDGHAVLVHLWRIHRDVIDNDDDLRIAASARIEAKRPGPARDDRADITIALIVKRDGVVNRLDHFLLRDGHFKLDAASAFEQPRDVFLELERLARIDTDALEDAVAIEQRV